MELFKHNNLLTSKFKTSGSQEIDYLTLFYNRRVVVFSLPVPLNFYSVRHLTDFASNYSAIKNLKVDEIYAVSSNPMLIPFVNKHAPGITALLDTNKEFVKLLNPESTHLDELAKLWQYVVIVNNGTIEKLFSNPLKTNMPMWVYYKEIYQYRSLGASKIIDYLNTTDIS